MLATHERFGWHDHKGQVQLAALASAAVVGLVMYTGNITLGLVLAAIPIGVFLVIDYVYIAALLFVAVSAFRIHEAYPFLLKLQLPLLLGAVVLAGTIYRALVTEQEIAYRARALKPLAVILAVATIALSFLFFLPVFQDLDQRASQALSLFVIVATLTTMTVWVMMLDQSSDVPWPREAWLLLAFFCFVSLTSAFAVDMPHSLYAWQVLYWKIGTIALSLIWLTRKPDDFARVFFIIIVSGLLIACVALYNAINGIDLVEGTRVTIGRALFDTQTKEEIEAAGGIYRPSGSLLGDPNDLALVLLLPLSFAAACLIERGSRAFFWLSLIALPILFSGIVVTQSRGAIIGVLAVAGVLGLRVIKSKLFLVSIGVAGLVAMVLIFDIAGRSSGGLAEYQEQVIDESAAGRIDAWTAAIRMTIRHPLTGIGMDNFQGMYYAYTDNWRGIAKAVHSTWFQVMAETGIFGFALFIGLMYATFRSIWTSIRTIEEHGFTPFIRMIAVALLGAFAGFCAAGTFLTQAFTWTIYVIIAMSAALSIYVRRLTLEQDAARAKAADGQVPPARDVGMRRGVAHG